MSSALHTRICDLLGIRYPIIQTGMGWVATPELVAAASNAGAIGFLAAATIRPEEVGAEIEKVKALTDQPFGVNFLMDAPGADVITDAIIRHGVKAAGYNRAPSGELIGQLKQAAFDALKLIARAGESDHDEHIHHAGDSGFRLADADRLHKHDIEARRFGQRDGLARGLGYAA